MAASNEKRVRVEFFSKIIASVRPRPARRRRLALGPARAGGLAGLGVVQDAPEVGGLELPDVEEVPRAGAHAAALRLGLGRLAGALQHADRLAASSR
jgi:hypothetical protein